MEMNQFDVVIASVFGRGHWLAVELARKNLKVLLVDLSSRCGVWPVEDIEGPFGVFKLDRFSDSFLEREAHEDPWEILDQGLTVWTRPGPLEFKGPMTRFHFQRRGFDEDSLELLAKGEVTGPQMKSRLKGDFSRDWPIVLAAQLASTRNRRLSTALNGGRLLPLAATFGVRFATRQGFLRQFEWLRREGVIVTDQSEILDLAWKSRSEVGGLELKGEISGVVKLEQLIWTLTGGETRFVRESLLPVLYPGGLVEPNWCWLRYRLTIEPSPETERLPLHVVLIEDLDSPWTHENLVILQKTPVKRNLDAWIRLPASQRFNVDYLREHGRRLTARFLERFPLSQVEVQDLPQEASYTTVELGEPRVPVWPESQDPTAGRKKASNLHFESPENRSNHSLECEYDHQKELRDRLWKWQDVRLLKKAKELREDHP